MDSPPYIPEIKLGLVIGADMRLSGADLRVLKVFDAVARHGSFAAAQAELNLNQSTISNHMTALEQRLGVKLCQRGRSGFKLTDKGEMVLEATRRLFQSLDEFAGDVGELRGSLMGTLKIGIIDCLVTDQNSKLPVVVAAFNADPNDVALMLSQESPQDLLEKVLNGVLHIGIGSFPHKVSGLSYELLYQESNSLYCAKKHPLYNVVDRNIDVVDLTKLAIVARGYWRDEYRKKLGFNNVRAEVFQIEPQLMLILSGSYLGFLPDHYAAHWVSSGVLRKVLPEQFSYNCPFELILKKGYRETNLVETFLMHLRRAYDL